MSREGAIRRMNMEFMTFKGMLNKLSLQDVQNAYTELLLLCEQAQSSSFYYYTFFEPSEEEAEAIPFITDDAKELIYRNARTHIKVFEDRQKQLRGRGIKMVENDELIDTKQGGDLLSDTYALVSAYQGFLGTKEAPTMATSQMKGYQQFKIRRYFKTFNPEKPEAIKETLRLHLPRWTTLPLEVGNLVSESSLPELKQFMTTLVESQDALSMVRPELLESGQWPIHLVFDLAQKIEAAGNKTLAYELSTKAILTLLKDEAARFRNQENPELPFFTFIFPHLASGEYAQKNKRMFFDFQDALNRVLKSTFERVEQQAEQPESNPAHTFLNEVAQVYGQTAPELIVKALLNQNRRTEAIEMAEVLSSIQALNQPWSQQAVEYFLALDSRQAVTKEEIEQLASFFEVETAQLPTTGERISTIEELVEEGDTYSFTLPLSQVATIDERVFAKVEVELEDATQSIRAVFKFESGQFGREFVFSTSFFGAAEAAMITTLGSQPVDIQTKTIFMAVVIKALQREASMAQAKKRSELETSKPVDIFIGESTRPSLTREQRMKLYELSQERAKRKRRKTSTSEYSVVGTEVPSKLRDERESAQKILVGGDIESVRQMMEEEKIEAVDPERITRKLEHVMEMANVSDKMLGKRVDTDSLGMLKIDVNLRQINLSLEGGSLAIRIYIEDMGDSTFVLRGMMVKKGEAVQQRYINKLLIKLVNEKKNQA